MTDLTKEDQAIDEARNELWYASDPKHNVTELEFTAFDCAWEACSAYKDKRIAELEKALEDIKNAGSFAVCIEVATEALSEGGGEVSDD